MPVAEEAEKTGRAEVGKDEEIITMIGTLIAAIGETASVHIDMM